MRNLKTGVAVPGVGSSVKGVSPVIASILIILVAVSMASAYIVFTDRIFGGVTEEGEETVSRTTQDLFSDFTISSASGQRVFIKNTGTSELSASALDVFYDSEPIEYGADFDILEEDELGTLTLRGLNEFGGGSHTVRVTAGSFSDSAGVRASATNGLLLDMRFDDGSGETASDISGNDYHGTLMNGPLWIQGRGDGALSFDGDDDFVSLPQGLNDQIGGIITVEVWLYRDNSSRVEGVVGARNNEAGFGVTMRGDSLNQHIFWHTGDSSFQHVESSSSIGESQWYHVVTNYDTNVGRRIYISGNLDAEDSVTGQLGDWTESIEISSLHSNGLERFDGAIDELRIYNRAYSANELENTEFYELSLRS